MHADRVREVTGQFAIMGDNARAWPESTQGVFHVVTNNEILGNSPYSSTTYTGKSHYTFTLSRVVPTGIYSAPRAFGALACVYLGS